MSNGDSCTENDSLLTSTPFHGVLVFNIICSSTALILNYRFLRNTFTKLYFHFNIRALIALSIIMNIMHSINFVILQSIQLYSFLTAKHNCDVMFYHVYCAFGRYPSVWAMFGHAVIAFAMLVERLLASFSLTQYETRCKTVGFLITSLSIVISFCIPLFAFFATPMDYQYGYCSAVTKYSVHTISFISKVMAGVEGSVVLLYFVLHLFNQYRLPRVDRRNYDLRVNYQLSENESVFYMLMPWILFHFCTFAFFYIGNGVVVTVFGNPTGSMARFVYALVNVIPEYCVISPLILWRISKSQRNKRRKRLTTLTSIKPTMEAYLKTYEWNK